MKGDRWRCRANGDLATELDGGWLRGDLLRLRLDKPMPRLWLWSKRVLYVNRDAWEPVGRTADA